MAVVGVCLLTAGVMLLIQPPDTPLRTLVQQFLVAFWTRPFAFGQSYGSLVLLAVKAAALIVALWYSARLIGRIIRFFLDRTQLEEGRKFALQRISAKVIFVFGLFTGIHAAGLDVGNLAVFSGGLGIGLGLGFQTIAKNFASGLILLFEQPVKVGDRVEVAGLQGDIVTIGFRATWVRTNDNVVVVVPNSEFIELQVTNLTLNDRSVRINVPVSVDYSSDPERVRKCLMDVARSHPDVLENPKPDVIFKGFGDSALDFNLRIWTAKRVTNPGVMASELYFKMHLLLMRDGIQIPYPQRDIHVRSITDAIATAMPAKSPSMADGSAPNSAHPSVIPTSRVTSEAGLEHREGHSRTEDELAGQAPLPDVTPDVTRRDG